MKITRIPYYSFEIPGMIKLFSVMTENKMILIQSKYLEKLPPVLFENRSYIVLGDKPKNFDFINFYFFSNIDIIIHLLKSKNNSFNELIILDFEDVFQDITTELKNER